VSLFLGYIFKWWFMSLLIGIFAFPLSFYLFRKTYDKGYFFSKIIAILVVGYFSWLLGFFKFGTGTIWLSILILIGMSAFAFMKVKNDILDFIKEKFALIIIAELFYFFIFFLYAIFRMYQPDIIGTEKFMDFAFMNAISRAGSMPPFDPWMAGLDAAGKQLHISYYYFGYVLMAIMMKLASVPNGSAFNLALTYVVALSALGMVGLLFNLTKSYIMGFLAAAFLLLISNMHGFLQIMQHHFTLDGFNWWQSSRVIDYKGYDVTINEFPFFSFLLGDMHPHQIAIPLSCCR